MIHVESSAKSAYLNRELRALAIAEEHFETIASSYRRLGSVGEYLVPSCSSRGYYRVTYTRKDESCGCMDWKLGNVCKHILSAAIVAAMSGVCSGCESRVRNDELVEVLEEDHLTWFAGDVICRSCADNSGVCY